MKVYQARGRNMRFFFVFEQLGGCRRGAGLSGFGLGGRGRFFVLIFGVDGFSDRRVDVCSC